MIGPVLIFVALIFIAVSFTAMKPRPQDQQRFGMKRASPLPWWGIALGLIVLAVLAFMGKLPSFT